MKKFLILCFFLSIVVTSWGKATQTDSIKVWEEFAENIDIITAIRSLGNDIQDQLFDTLPEIDDSIRNEIKDSISFSLNNYIGASVLPLIQENFSFEEAETINQFYRTALGQKLKEIQPMIVAQLSKEINRYSENLDHLLIRILQKHNILPPSNDD